MLWLLKPIFLIYFIWKILEILAYKWRAAMSRYAKMNWKTIKSLYKVNPKKWRYDFGYCDDEIPIRILYYNDTPIMLNVIDFIKFRIAYKIYAYSNGTDRENREALENIINDVQKDIDKMNGKVDEATVSAVVQIQESFKREKLNKTLKEGKEEKK